MEAKEISINNIGDGQAVAALASAIVEMVEDIAKRPGEAGKRVATFKMEMKPDVKPVVLPSKEVELRNYPSAYYTISVSLPARRSGIVTGMMTESGRFVVSDSFQGELQLTPAAIAASDNAALAAELSGGQAEDEDGGATANVVSLGG